MQLVTFIHSNFKANICTYAKDNVPETYVVVYIYVTITFEYKGLLFLVTFCSKILLNMTIF